MKYGATIQDLAARGHKWRFYDENFCLLRQSPATSLPWGNIHMKLWLRSQGTLKKITISGRFREIRFHNYNYYSQRILFLNFTRAVIVHGVLVPSANAEREGPHRALHCKFRIFGKSKGQNSRYRVPSKPSGSQTLPQSKTSTPTNIQSKLLTPTNTSKK